MCEFAHTLFWFRRDLRLADNAGLYHALKRSQRVSCIFIFDLEILDALPTKRHRRVEFIRESLAEIERLLRRHGTSLTVLHGRPIEDIPALAKRRKADAVFANRDYEPDAVRRDRAVDAALAKVGIEFATFKDQVIFEQDEVLTQNSKPFSVFTPYKNAWLKRLSAENLRAYPSENHLDKLVPMPAAEIPSLESIGFEPSNLKSLSIDAGPTGASKRLNDFLQRIDRYHETRNFPAVKGPSHLSVHLRFGTISIRTLARAAWERDGCGAQTWLNELIWREFYFMILHQHPRVVGEAFRPEFKDLRFLQDQGRFAAWCEARTGYPLVDAAMRQLNQTGYMHNRLRMVTASFLVKDLLIDWRWGERYFAKQLNDYDVAANNGGWQWAASTGCDAQPYFRIFNPVTQSEKFDPAGTFIRRYVPELAAVSDKFIHAPWRMTAHEQTRVGLTIGRDYPNPIVDHAQARRVALNMYASATPRTRQHAKHEHES